MSILWCCPSNIYSAEHGVAYPLSCLEGWFWRGCGAVSWQLPGEVHVDPQRSWSCFPPSRWSDADFCWAGAIFAQGCSQVLKLVTSSNLWPFVLKSALMLFVLLVMVLLFSVLTSIPCTIAVSTCLLVRSLSSPLLPPIRSMSSANRRLHTGLPPMEMDVCWSWSIPAWSSPSKTMDIYRKTKQNSSGVDVFNIVGTYSMMALTNSFTILEKYGKHGNYATFLFLAHQGNPERILFFGGPIRGPRLAEEKNSGVIPLTNLKIKRCVL